MSNPFVDHPNLNAPREHHRRLGEMEKPGQPTRNRFDVFIHWMGRIFLSLLFIFFGGGPSVVCTALTTTMAVSAYAETPDGQIFQTDAARSKIGPQISPFDLTGSDTPSQQNALAAPKLMSDAEYGEQIVLTRKAHVEPWSASIDAQYFYTNNVALVPQGAKGDFYLRSGALVQYTNRIGGDWFFNADVSDYFYVYDRYHEFDFDLIRGEIGVLRAMPWLGNNAFLTAQYVWYKISEPDFTGSALTEDVASFGLQKLWKISRGQQLSAGLSADISLAGDPAVLRRDEFAAFLGYRLRLTEKFTVQAGCRGACDDYQQAGRLDWNDTILVGCSYELNRWARLQLSTSESWNHSNQSAFGYENWIGGVGLTLHIVW